VGRNRHGFTFRRTTERIRCKGDYKVDSGGTALYQALRCASDSYKFDLSSNVRSERDRIVGTWGEASRNINGDPTGARVNMVRG
jgi:hypothetical protein